MLSSRAAAFSVKALLDPNPEKGKVTDTLHHQPFGTIGTTGKSLWKKKGRTKSKNHGGGDKSMFTEGYNGLTESPMEWDQHMEALEEEELPHPRILSFESQGLDNRIFKDDHDKIFEEDEEELVDVENCIESSGHTPHLPLGETTLGINSPPSSPMGTIRHRGGRPSSQFKSSNYLSPRFPSASSSANSDWQMYVPNLDMSMDRGEASIKGGGRGGRKGPAGNSGVEGLRSDPSSCYGREEIRIQLLQGDLWTKFNDLKTEMIITKNGRRMFPVVKVGIQGLHPEKSYMVFLDMVAVDDRRYRYVYQSSRWMVAGTGEPLGEHEPYIHPDSPSTGGQWMAVPAVAFDRLKLTNNKTRQTKGQIILHSMQKYQPRVWVQEVDATASDLPNLVDFNKAISVSFPETTFITVTAYQNQQITRLKIDSNPFAKGFRDTTKQKELLERRLLPDAAVHENAALASMPYMLPLGVPRAHPHHLPLGGFPGQYAYTCPTSLPQYGLACPNPPTQYPHDPAGQPTFSLRSPVSPPISPVILPPQWYPDILEGATGAREGGGGSGGSRVGNRNRGGRGDVPWIPGMSGAAFYRSRSMPVLFPSYLPAYHGQLPHALDLSKRKGDT